MKTLAEQFAEGFNLPTPVLSRLWDSNKILHLFIDLSAILLLGNNVRVVCNKPETIKKLMVNYGKGN